VIGSPSGHVLDGHDALRLRGARQWISSMDLIQLKIVVLARFQSQWSGPLRRRSQDFASLSASRSVVAQYVAHSMREKAQAAYIAVPLQVIEKQALTSLSRIETVRLWINRPAGGHDPLVVSSVKRLGFSPASEPSGALRFLSQGQPTIPPFCPPPHSPESPSSKNPYPQQISNLNNLLTIVILCYYIRLCRRGFVALLHPAAPLCPIL